MPSIRDQVTANKARMAGDTGTSVAAQAPIPSLPTPLQDLPAGGGLPQRGMFPADTILSSDRSDSNRAFRGAGKRSSTFPYSSPSISSTIIQKVAATGTGGGTSNLSGLVAGPGISITSAGKSFTVAGTVGSLQMPSIFTVGGALPVTAYPNAGPMVVGLATEPEFTFFAGPYPTSLVTTFDNATTGKNAGAVSSASLTFTPSSTDNEWAVFAVSGVTSLGNDPVFQTPSGWTMIEPTVGANGQGYAFATNLTSAQTATSALANNGAWVGVGALFFAKNSTPVVVQNGFSASIGSSTTHFTFGSNTTATNSILAIIEYTGVSQFGFSSLTDTQGNTYKLLASSSQANGFGTFDYVAVLYAENIVGGANTTTLISNAGVSTQGVIWYAEISGLTAGAAIPTFRHIQQNDLQFAIFGASGPGHAPGATPDPGGTAGTWRFLREDATWAVPEGGAVVKTANYTALASDNGKLLTFNTTGIPTFVQGRVSAYGSAQSSISLAFNSNNAAGNFIVVFATGPTNTALTISDTNSNTYTQLWKDAVTFGASNVQVAWFAPNIASGANTITVSWTGNTNPAIIICEYSGVATSSPLDVSATSTGTGNWTTASIITTQAEELLVAVNINGNGGDTTNAPFIQRFITTTGGINYGLVADETVSATGTYSASGNGNSSFTNVIAGFKAGISNLTLTLPATAPSTSWNIYVENDGGGSLTINPNGLKLDGSTSNLTVPSNQGVYITTDGTNYFTERGLIPATASEIPAAGVTGDVQFNIGGFLGASANLFWDNTNNRLGIDTNSPSYALHVKGSGAQIIVTQDTSATGYSGHSLTGTGTQAYSVLMGGPSEVAFGIANKFSIYDNLAGAVRLTIDTSGRVGIGITAPVDNLFVHVNTNRNFGVTDSTVGGTDFTFFRSVNDVANTVEPLAIQGNPVVLGAVVGGGNVGINTVGPLAPLDVNAAASNSVGLGIGNGTSASATAGAATLPANPTGFLVWYLAGTIIKIPYYNA